MGVPRKEKNVKKPRPTRKDGKTGKLDEISLKKRKNGRNAFARIGGAGDFGDLRWIG